MVSIKKSLITILAVFGTFGTLGKVSALELDDIKDHLSEHKVAYGVGAGVSAVVITFTLWYNMRATNLPIEEDDDDLEDDLEYASILKK